MTTCTFKMRIYNFIHFTMLWPKETCYQFEVATLVGYWFLPQVPIHSWEKSTSFWRHLKDYLFCICGRTSDVCYHEVPRYYVKEVQGVILLNMCHLNNMMIFLFPIRVILKRTCIMTFHLWVETLLSCSIWIRVGYTELDIVPFPRMLSMCQF